jgi:hypothetical protein
MDRPLRAENHHVRRLGLLAVLAGLLLTPSAAAEPRGCSGSGAHAAVECAGLPVVGSLDSRYRTARPRYRPTYVPDGCRRSEFVFYAARDWLRLAAKLAERASPCADYYVSIPPLVADKTKPRPNQARYFRALGPRFHALAEIHFATWQRWVRATGSTWYDAGREARRRMAAAGYDAANGDTWALNEVPSSVRRDLGTAREGVREFVRGLHDGDGRPLRGAVFVIGVRHGTENASLYKSTLKSWLGDTPFWRDMERAVRWWGQEVYADARRWGVPGASPDVRREYLNDFFQHAARLGSVAPGRYGVATAFLERAHTPIANAGWQWPAGLGWTMLTGDQMRHFVSSQTDALRSFAATKTGPDRFGFAWAPNNELRLPEAAFVAETDLLLERLGSAMTDSGMAVLGARDACDPTGVDWCRADVGGADFTEAWGIFSAWEALVRLVPDVKRRLVDFVRAVLAGSG